MDGIQAPKDGRGRTPGFISTRRAAAARVCSSAFAPKPSMSVSSSSRGLEEPDSPLPLLLPL
eukprot:7707707-Pyramimonas_sp.AAC.1